MATSMYDLIMDLPLLQGISRAQVSSLIEKINMDFVNVKAGELIRDFGIDSEYLLYVIKGIVEMEWHNREESVAIRFTQGRKALLGAANLFGMHRAHPYAAKAATDCSLLRISKRNYFSILTTQPVYLYNYLNYLSIRAQKPLEALACHRDGSLKQLLQFWVKTITPTTAENIVIKVTKEALYNFTNLSKTAIQRSLSELRRQGLITLGEGIIKIPNRHNMTDEYK